MQFRFDKVTVEYSGIAAISDVSFEYDGSGIMMLTGATGAGKTTLLRLLYADILPTSGHVYVDGLQTSTMKAKMRRELRRKLGIVQQDCKLVNDYTVFENVLMPFALRRFARSDANSRALELLADLGVSYIRHKMPRQLSGGERHLVALARALAMNPSVIVADEPTGTLDDKTASAVAENLQASVARGVGLIASTHSKFFSLAFPQAQRYVLEEGVLKKIDSSVPHTQEIGSPRPEAAI